MNRDRELADRMSARVAATLDPSLARKKNTGEES